MPIFEYQKQQNTKAMKTRQQIQYLAEAVLEERGGDALGICCGDCPDYAKRLIELAGEGLVVDFLADDMKSELEGYKVISPEADDLKKISHCWVAVDCVEGRWFFDAFNPAGVDDESELNFQYAY